MEGITYVKIDLIDPHPNQPRVDYGDIAGLAGTIEALGILDPLIVVANGDRYWVCDGHRRLRGADMAGLDAVPVRVFPDWDQAEQVSAMLATSSTHKALTGAEEAAGLQTLLSLGVEPQIVAQRTARPATTVVAATSALGTLGEKAVNLDLDELAALNEFADDKKATNRLLDSAGKPGFAWELESLRKSRARRERDAETKARLAEAGVRVIKQPSWDADAVALSRRDWGTAEEHATCPGHCAWIEYDGSVAYGCDQTALHGDERDLEREQRAAQDEARRAAEAQRTEDFDIAAELRRNWLLHTFMGGKALPKTVMPFVADLAYTRGLPGIGQYANTALVELRDLFGAHLKAEQWDRRILAVALTWFEKTYEAHRNGRFTYMSYLPECLAYLRFCRDHGHHLSPVEESDLEWLEGVCAPKPEDASCATCQVHADGDCEGEDLGDQDHCDEWTPLAGDES